MPHRALPLLAALSLPLAACGDDECRASVEWGSAVDWADAPADVPSWEWILESEAIPAVPPAVDYIGVDLEDVDAAWIEAAHAQGTQVWCYISVGSAESYREDYATLQAVDDAERSAGREGVIGRPLDGWRGERWLNPRAYEAFFSVMQARIDRCAAAGFDLIEFDNIDAYDNETGFAVSAEEQVAYVAALADAAVAAGLAPILKNGTDLPFEDSTRVQFGAVLLEACALYDFCEDAAPYAAAGVPVFNAEYPDEWTCDEGRAESAADICADAPDGTLLKNWDLDARSVVCAAL